jgi:hypothetical protein
MGEQGQVQRSSLSGLSCLLASGGRCGGGGCGGAVVAALLALRDAEVHGPVVAPESATLPERSAALAADICTLTPVHHTTVTIHIALLSKGFGAVGAHEGLGALVHHAHVLAQRPALRKPLPALGAPETALPTVRRSRVHTQTALLRQHQPALRAPVPSARMRHQPVVAQLPRVHESPGAVRAAVRAEGGGKMLRGHVLPGRGALLADMPALLTPPHAISWRARHANDLPVRSTPVQLPPPSSRPAH